jgi:hypothetical protein
MVGRLANLADVSEVRTNPRTGSILIRHSGSAQAIASRAAALGEFALGREKLAGDPAPAAGMNPLRVAAVGLSGLGLYQAARGRPLGSAVESFWQAYGAHAVLKRPWVAWAFAGFGVYQLAQGELFAAASSLFFHALTAEHLAAGGDGKHASAAADPRPDPSRPTDAAGQSPGSGPDVRLQPG